RSRAVRTDIRSGGTQRGSLPLICQARSMKASSGRPSEISLTWRTAEGAVYVREVNGGADGSRGPQLGAHQREGVEHLVELLPRVRRHDRRAQPAGVLRHGRGKDRVGEDARVEQRPPEGKGALHVTGDDRDDGGLRADRVEAQ